MRIKLYVGLRRANRHNMSEVWEEVSNKKSRRLYMLEPHNDQSLRARTFTVKEPEKLENLLKTIPPEAGLPVIEYAYDVTPAKGKPRSLVYCAHCHHPTHFRGYVVKWGNGCRCLVGKDCGARNYGADFHLIEKAFREERRRNVHLLRLDALIYSLPSVLRAISEIASAPALADFDTVRERMQSEAPTMWSALEAAAETGELVVEELVRDIRAEERRAARRPDVEFDKNGKEVKAKDAKDDQPIYVKVERVIGRMGGVDFFFGRRLLLPIFRAEHERLKEVLIGLRRLDTDRMKTSKLKNLVDDTVESVEDLYEYSYQVNALPEFFSQKNLLVVAGWLNQLRGFRGHVEVRGLALHFTPPMRDVPRVFKAPPAFNMSNSFAPLQGFRSKVSGDDHDRAAA